MKALLIHHEKAGEGSVSAERLCEAIGDAGWKVRCLPRKQADNGSVAEAEADLVVIAGGDGTVAKVLTELDDRSVPTAIIPTGTANDIAGSLGLCGAPEEVPAGWDPARRRRFDIGRVDGAGDGRRFVEGVGFGAFAESLRQAPDSDGAEKLRVGREAFAAALGEAKPLPLEIEVDGEALPGRLLLVELLNISLAGPRLPLAPDADPGDGRLDVVFLRSANRDRFRRWVAAGGKGAPPLERTSGRRAVVRGGPAAMRIDDECRCLEPDCEVIVELEREPFEILAPPEES